MTEKARRIEVWHVLQDRTAFHWGTFYNWNDALQMIDEGALRLRFSVRRVIRPRAIQLILR